MDQLYNKALLCAGFRVKGAALRARKFLRIVPRRRHKSASPAASDAGALCGPARMSAGRLFYSLQKEAEANDLFDNRGGERWRIHVFLSCLIARGPNCGFSRGWYKKRPEKTGPFSQS